jgi:hypothetical protein
MVIYDVFIDLSVWGYVPDVHTAVLTAKVWARV